MTYVSLVVFAILSLGLGVILKKFVPELHVCMCVLIAVLVVLLLYVVIGLATGKLALTN